MGLVVRDQNTDFLVRMVDVECVEGLLLLNVLENGW